MSITASPISKRHETPSPCLPLFSRRPLVEIIRTFDLDLANEDFSITQMAERAFPLIGVGGHASVFIHPDDDGLVIRLTDYPDGWFAYAAEVMMLHEDHGIFGWTRFAPVVHELVVCDDLGIYAAVTERLCHRQGTGFEKLGNLVRYARSLRRGSPSYIDVIARIEDEQPGIDQFFEYFWTDLVDLHPGNIMYRDRTLIFNDPRGRPLSPHEITKLETDFGFETSPAEL